MMTREKAIERLKEGEPFSEIFDSVWDEALNMAIKALEQEPCEDAVSRNAVKDKLIRLWNTSADEDYKFETLRDYIVDLPSVNPTTDLSKIRAEIVDLGQRTMNDNRASGIWACRDIIDKYKAESEESNADSD